MQWSNVRLDFIYHRSYCHILLSLEWLPMCRCNSSLSLNLSSHCSQFSNNGNFKWKSRWLSRSPWSIIFSSQRWLWYCFSSTCSFLCSLIIGGERVKSLSHILQWKVPFMWILWCFKKCFAFEKDLLQWLQGKSLSAICWWRVFMCFISSFDPANRPWQCLHE